MARACVRMPESQRADPAPTLFEVRAGEVPGNAERHLRRSHGQRTMMQDGECRAGLLADGDRPEAWMRDPETVAGIVSALRQVHGDGVARLLLSDGLSLAALIDALLRAPLRNSDAVKLIKGALSSGDFIVTPDVSRSPSHLRYVYDPPKSLHVVDVNLITLDYGTLASTDIHLRLVPNGN